jgi:ATPase subunit of ABC transporter with duplicated ATPase domains
MGRLRAASLVLAALAVGLLLAACGGGGNGELLPGATADQITSHLDQVRLSYEEGDCEKAEDGVANVSTEVDELGKVDAKLKKALRQGAAKLSEVVSSCRAEEEEKDQAAEEAEQEEEQEIEAEELAAEEESFEKEQKSEEREQKAEEKEQEQAEKHAEQPGPPDEGEESNGKGKGQEEIEPPAEGEEEVIPPTTGEGPAGGIGPGAEAGGGEG